MRRIQGLEIGECDCCGHGGPVSTLHTLGHIKVCDTCLLDCGAGQNQAAGIPECETLSVADHSHDAAMALADEVWDRR